MFSNEGEVRQCEGDDRQLVWSQTAVVLLALRVAASPPVEEVAVEQAAKKVAVIKAVEAAKAASRGSRM